MPRETTDHSASAAAKRENATTWTTTGPRPVPLLPVMVCAIFFPAIAYVFKVIDYKTGTAIVLGMYASWMTLALLLRRRRVGLAPPPRQEGETSDLGTAAREQKRVRCAGRIRCATRIESPREGRACAAYLARWPLGAWASEVVCEAAPMEIETETGDPIEIETGRWRLDDPFGRLEQGGEATLDDGAEIVVHARVEQLGSANDATYRSGSVRYRLLCEGGEVVPALGYASRSVIERKASIAGDVFYASLVAAVAAGAMLVSRGHITKYEYTGEKYVPGVNAPCGDDHECGKDMRCVGGLCKWPKPHGPRSGEICTPGAACVPGLHCKPIDPEMVLPDHQDPEAPPGNERTEWRCTEACRDDKDCPHGKLCVPCRGTEDRGSYDGNCFARGDLWGKLAHQCDAAHARPQN